MTNWSLTDFWIQCLSLKPSKEIWQSVCDSLARIFVFNPWRAGTTAGSALVSSGDGLRDHGVASYFNYTYVFIHVHFSSKKANANTRYRAEPHRGFFLTSGTNKRPTPLCVWEDTLQNLTQKEILPWGLRMFDSSFAQLQEFGRIPMLFTASSTLVSSASNLAWHQFTERGATALTVWSGGVSKDQMGGILNQTVWGPLEL